MSLACSWCQAGDRLAPRFPAPSMAARGVPPLATPSSRAASPPPDAQSAVRHAGGLPALALTTARPRYGLLRPSASAAAVESDPFGTVPARSSHACQGLPTPPPHCASRSARNFRETFRCAETCPETSVLSPLTRAAEGVQAWQAKRRRTGAGARAAPIPQASRLVKGQTRKVLK